MDKLAQELGLSLARTKQLWDETTDLDGDERVSLAHAFRFAYDGDGAVNTAKIETGLAKLRKA